MFRRRPPEPVEDRLDALQVEYRRLVDRFINALEAEHSAHIIELKDAHAEERRALNKVIEALAEQVEYLRALLGTAHMSSHRPATQGLATSLPPEPGRTLHLSEEEEDLLALRENDLISDAELENLRAQLQEELGPGVLIS